MELLNRRTFVKGAALGTVGAGLAGSLSAASADEASQILEVSQLNAGWLEPEPETPEPVETVTADVIVLGGGTGGLYAAASTSEKGLKTIVIEQNETVSTVRNDFGSISSKYQQAEGVTVDKRAVMNYHIMQNSARFDQRLQKIWAEESGAAVDWVGGLYEQYGAQMLYEGGYEPEFTGHNIPKFPTGHSGHFENCEKYASGCEIFQQYILDNGGEFRFSTAFVKFEHDGKKVTAAIAQDKTTGDYIRFVGEKGIILATGGYQGNNEMLKALQPETFNLCLSWGSSCAGAGIKACLWMGAEMDDAHSTMLFDRAGLLPTETQADFSTFAFFQLGSQPWLKVNLKGERFMNESALYDYAPHACSMQPGKLCISVLDANYWQNITQFETVGCSRVYPFPNGTPNDGQLNYADDEYESRIAGSLNGWIESGIMQQADTLEELAEKMGLPVETFVATVERYNELAKNGDDEDFYKDAYRMIPLETPPFYAIRNSSMILSTLDGIRIDTHSHPLGTDGEPFEGLYVVGDSSGSFFAHSYPNLVTGYANGRTCTFARRIAREINGEEVKDYTIIAK